MSSVDVLPLSPPATSSGSRTRPLYLFASKPTTSTPDNSPASGPESSSLASKKKVEFSPWADIHHPSALVTSLLDSSGVKALPPSRECQSYIKSILKSSAQDENPSSGFDGPADEKSSLNEVMESIVQQLAKNDNTETIDAYQTLASTIKAYDDIPEQAVLKNKLTTITRHIRQHLGTREKQEAQPSDVNLVTSALKVLVILVWNVDFAALLSDDFRSFILDRSVSVITEHTAPKSVLVHYLHLLATQNFRSGLLTANGRASRLIEALKGLTEHVKGNGVVSERLLVYQRLLEQARPVMKSKSTQWVEHMLSAMASTIADTRNKALALGRKACQAFPASSSISGSVRTALDLKQENGRTLGMSICRRLEKMVMGKDDAVQVPQIWAVILLLCNNSSMRIDAWQGLKEWLMVIQRCFNGSDTSLRLQANSAWNRFVYIARPHEASDSLVAMLSKPVAAQLERSANDKSSKASHAVAISSYCNLLYYAFRPATTLSQYNRVWNEYVVKVMGSSFLERSSGNADVASRILMTLFWDAKKNTKLWNENRAHENRLVEPEELPTIDCKWTRSRCSPILEIFQVLFQHSSWGFPGSQDQAYVAKAWRHFLKALREAGSKEIKMSNETRAAAVSILKFLTKLWHQQELADKDHASDSSHLQKEVLTNISFGAIAELGVERILDLVETEPMSYSTSLFLVIFELLRLDLESGSRPHLPLMRLFSIVNDSLEVRYQCKSCTVYSENCAFLDMVSRLLSTLPLAVAEDAMKALNSGLATWLEDKDGCFSPSANLGPEQSQRVAAVLERFVDAFVTALALIPPSGVGALDASLAAAFASSHGTVLSAVTEMWNKRFGTSDEVEIGPQLSGAIGRLLPYVELALPSSWEVEGRDEACLPAPVFETQFESAPEAAAEPLMNQPLEMAGESAVPRLEESVAANMNEDIDKDCQMIDRRVEPPASSRKRHYDSQIHFVPIEPSSPVAAAEESQFLTSNQKEVRDRQCEEPAVTFTDLRSSPRPQSRHSEPRDCGFARKAATMIERPTTPTLPEHNDAMDGHPEPSPTPKSRVLRAVSEVDVPSSPPSMQGNTERADVEMDNVSSPIPDAIEAEDQQVQLESPRNPSTAGLQQEKANADADGENASEDEDGRVSQVLESAEAPVDTDAAAQPEDRAGTTTNEMIEGSPAATHAVTRDVDYEELPSSPPKQTEARIATPPHRSSSVFNTDELEELSASQLSHDLDWSTVLEGLDTPPTASKSPRPVNSSNVSTARYPVSADVAAVEHPAEHADAQDAPVNEGEVALPPPTQKKRKRPQSGYAEPKKKRRKSSRSQSQSTSSQVSFYKREEEEELLDCIVVDTSSEYLGSSSPLRQSEEQADDYLMSQSAEVQQDKSNRTLDGTAIERGESLAVEGGLRRRGRPRKSRSQVKQEPTGSEEGLDEMLEESSTSRKFQRSRSRRGSRNRMSVEISVEPEPQRAKGTPYVLIPTVEVTAPTSTAAQPPEREEEQASGVVDVERSQAPSSAAAPQVDIVAQLQTVLGQIKTSGLGAVDLRAVDELCFQIRYHAQTTAMGQVQ